MQYTYWDVFPLLKTVFELIDFDDFQCFCCFLFHLFHIGKTFPFKDFLHPGKQTNKKVPWCKIRWLEKVEPGGQADIGQKLLSTHWDVDRYARISPIMEWANVLKVFKKISLKPNATSLNTTSWYTDTDGFLEHSHRGGSLYYKGPALQKIIPMLGRFPLYVLHTVLETGDS